MPPLFLLKTNLTSTSQQQFIKFFWNHSKAAYTNKTSLSGAFAMNTAQEPLSRMTPRDTEASCKIYSFAIYLRRARWSNRYKMSYFSPEPASVIPFTLAKR